MKKRTAGNPIDDLISFDTIAMLSSILYNQAVSYLLVN